MKLNIPCGWQSILKKLWWFECQMIEKWHVFFALNSYYKIFFFLFLISIPKCIELNSESGSRWVLGLGLGPGPRPEFQKFVGSKKYKKN